MSEGRRGVQLHKGSNGRGRPVPSETMLFSRVGWDLRQARKDPRIAFPL